MSTYREREQIKGKKMRKIVLLSVLFGLITNSVFATYYRTTTSNCSDAAMRAKLNRATADHRAVITEVSCDYTVPQVTHVITPAPVVVRKPIVHHYVVKPRPVIVEYVPVTVVSVEEESCACMTCDC